MSIIDTIGKAVGGIASPLSAAIGVVNGVKSLFGSDPNKGIKTQYKYQRLLNEQQNMFAQENATTDYLRQRKLTHDVSSLSKKGMQDAGLNPAFHDGSTASAANVNGVAAPSAGSVGLPPNSQELQLAAMQSAFSASSLMQDYSVKAANARNLNAEANLKETDSLTRLSENLLRLQELEANAKDADTRALADRFKFDLLQKYGMSNADLDNQIKASKAIKEANEASVSGAMNEVEYNTKVAQLELLKEQKGLPTWQKKEIEQSIKNLKQAYRESVSRTAKNYSDIELNKHVGAKLDSETVLNNLDAYIKDTTKDDAIELAHRQVEEHGPQSISQDMWSIFNDWDNADGWQRTRAIMEIAPSILTDFWSGASAGVGQNLTKHVDAGKSGTKRTIVEYRSKAKPKVTRKRK